MADGCWAQCSKGLLFLLNFFVLIAGTALLAIGIWLLVDDSSRHYIDLIQGHEGSSQQSLRAACITLIVVGALAAVISFCGCCGAIKENPCLLNTYAAILILILIVLVVGGILGAVYKNDISAGVAKSMNTTVQTQYGLKGFEKETDSWDALQVDLKCCGAYGPADWKSSAWAKNASDTVPVTCCVLTNKDPTNPKPVNQEKCQQEASSPTGTHIYLHSQGCDQAWTNFMKANADIIIGVTFGFAGLMLLGAIMACCLRTKPSNRAGYQYV